MWGCYRSERLAKAGGRQGHAVRTASRRLQVRFRALVRQKGLPCGVTTSDDPRGALSPETLPPPPRGYGNASFASSSRILDSQPCWWRGLRRKLRRPRRFLRAGRSLTRCLFRVEVAQESTGGQSRMLERSPGPFPPPPTPGRWRGRDTCAAAGSRRLRAALGTRATVSIK